ncbi:competence protein ComEC [Leucobacter exalbidus]|uniref:Competence protein ComEC n=2 Tax=Leucobacter exalbidus TaxID=662960 RepID=A0A940PRV0_9MICO|nr:competence protein ComEC [Leucobacter exalbidus]
MRTVAAGVALGGFVLIVGPDTSVQRAAIMGAVLLVSSYGGKRAVALPALGLAIAVLLIIDPWQAWQPGFALSVAATGGIIVCAPELTEGLRRLTGAPMWIALPVAVSAAAQFACGPLLLLLQDGIPASGLLANVLAGPAAPAGTGLGLAALLAGPVSPALGQALVVAASFPARWVEATAQVAAELPFARWDWVPGVPGALLLCGVEAALVAAWLLATGRLTRSGARVIRPWMSLGLGPRKLRTWVAVLLGAAAGALVGPTLVAPVMQQAEVPSGWRIVACDVGQGDAILLRGGGAAPGEAVLIDTGDDETQLRACLRQFGISRIPLLVLTHDDRDHIGAVGAILPQTARVLIAPPTREDREHRPMVAQLEAADVSWEVGSAGDSGDDAGVAWALLAPDRGLTPASRNAASLVMRADTGGLTALLLADTGEAEQGPLLAKYDPAQTPAGDAAAAGALVADVVKVAHHGSRDQHPGMYGAVHARVGLVSVGEGNGYGHPARDLLTSLARADTLALRTDLLGSIAISPGDHRGAGPTIWAARGRPVSSDE